MAEPSSREFIAQLRRVGFVEDPGRGQGSEHYLSFSHAGRIVTCATVPNNRPHIASLTMTTIRTQMGGITTAEWRSVLAATDPRDKYVKVLTRKGKIQPAPAALPPPNRRAQPPRRRRGGRRSQG